MTTKIRIINAVGVLTDTKPGKVYSAEDVVPGEPEVVYHRNKPAFTVVPNEAGYSFRDEVGDYVGLQLSTVDDQFGIDWEFAE